MPSRHIRRLQSADVLRLQEASEAYLVTERQDPRVLRSIACQQFSRHEFAATEAHAVEGSAQGAAFPREWVCQIKGPPRGGGGLVGSLALSAS
jgi:hypothetical protein